GLEAEETAPDDDGAGCAAERRRQPAYFVGEGSDVVERPVDVGVLGSGDRQAGGVRAGREDDVVEGHLRGRGAHDPGLEVDLARGFTREQPDLRLLPQRGVAEGEVDLPG